MRLGVQRPTVARLDLYGLPIDIRNLRQAEVNVRRYLTICVRCRCATSRQYAREHGGLCKGCNDPYNRPKPKNERESQSSKHCDSGYMNDLRFGDNPDY